MDIIIVGFIGFGVGIGIMSLYIIIKKFICCH